MPTNLEFYIQLANSQDDIDDALREWNGDIISKFAVEIYEKSRPRP